MNTLNWTKVKAGEYIAQVGSLYLTQEALSDYPKSTYEQYSYTIAKEGSKWVVWADDHSETDFDENNFKTLKQAQAYIQDHAEYLLECWQEMWAEDDAQDNLAEIETENARLNAEKMNPDYHIEETVKEENVKEEKEETEENEENNDDEVKMTSELLSIIDSCNKAFDKVANTGTEVITKLINKLSSYNKPQKISMLVAMIKSNEYKDIHLVALASIAVLIGERTLNKQVLILY